MNKKYQLILVSILLITGIVVLLPGHSSPGQRPNITLSFLDGTSVDLGTMKNQPLLINFWATTCSVCIHELPELIALYKEKSGDGLHVISIAMPYDPPNFVLDVSKQFEIPYPVALDINGEAMQAFGDVKATPSSFLFAPDGTLVSQQTGRTNFNELRLKIETLLAMQTST